MALKRMGFDGRMCGHGFRALAVTNIQELLGIDLRIVDRQLAHIEKNKVTAAYNRAEYWPQRATAPTATPPATAPAWPTSTARSRAPPRSARSR
jgi:hypothetical protein